MTHAYAATYLADAEDCLSAAVDYAVHDAGVTADNFAWAFMQSGLARRFECGDPLVVSGMTGIELAARALTACHMVDEPSEPTFGDGRSQEYWAGWAAARFQWTCGCRFEDLFGTLSLSSIVGLYHPLHEADTEVVMEQIERQIGLSLVGSASRPTRISQLRRQRGLTQGELAQLVGVTVKSIQAYEQRINSLNRATAETVMRIARVLGCTIDDLLEPFEYLAIEYNSSKRSR